MNSLDYLIVGFYAVALIAIATYVSRSKKGQEKTPEDYFLAGRSLPWWAIGTSLIAANIAADQIIGMNGDAYAFGMANASTAITKIRYSCQQIVSRTYVNYVRFCYSANNLMAWC